MPMKPSRSRQPSTCARASLPAQREIDALYGLEPIFEPGHEADQAPGQPWAFHGVRCPYCGEGFDTLIDASGGAATYIEDCRVCCQPVEFELRVDAQGMLGVSVRRS